MPGWCYHQQKGDRNDDSSPKFTHIHNTLLMSIIDTTGNNFYLGKGKSVTRKVRTSPVNYYSTLFLCSISAKYNRFCCAKSNISC